LKNVKILTGPSIAMVILVDLDHLKIPLTQVEVKGQVSSA
jgi:hypothetical protein